MAEEKEITAESLLPFEEIKALLLKAGFTVRDDFFVEDRYFTDKAKGVRGRELLEKTVLTRHFFDREKTRKKVLCCKRKKLDEKGDIILDEKTECEITDTEKAREFLLASGFRELVFIPANLVIFEDPEEEILVQRVGDRVYIEIESFCRKGNFHRTEEEMKNFFTKYSIPIKNNDFYAKKLLDALGLPL